MDYCTTEKGQEELMIKKEIVIDQEEFSATTVQEKDSADTPEQFSLFEGDPPDLKIFIVKEEPRDDEYEEKNFPVVCDNPAEDKSSELKEKVKLEDIQINNKMDCRTGKGQEEVTIKDEIENDREASNEAAVQEQESADTPERFSLFDGEPPEMKIFLEKEEPRDDQYEFQSLGPSSSTGMVVSFETEDCDRDILVHKEQPALAKQLVLACSNCGTRMTTIWRKNPRGERVCNACALYYKVNNVNRPAIMRRDIVHIRRRRPRGVKMVIQRNSKRNESSNCDR